VRYAVTVLAHDFLMLPREMEGDGPIAGETSVEIVEHVHLSRTAGGVKADDDSEAGCDPWASYDFGCDVAGTNVCPVLVENAKRADLHKGKAALGLDILFRRGANLEEAGILDPDGTVAPRGTGLGAVLDPDVEVDPEDGAASQATRGRVWRVVVRPEKFSAAVRAESEAGEDTTRIGFAQNGEWHLHRAHGLEKVGEVVEVIGLGDQVDEILWFPLVVDSSVVPACPRV